MENLGVFMFHLSFDGGASYSRALPMTLDENGFNAWLTRWNLQNDPDWKTARSFYDGDVSGLGANLADARVNHIWGFEASKNYAFFDGERKLNLYTASDVGRFKPVWWALRDIGGKSGVNDTVLFNHEDAEDGPGNNIYAILYDYSIETDDVANNIRLIPIHEEIV